MIFDHIGIIVKNIDKAVEILVDDHNLKRCGNKVVETEIDVILQFLVDDKGLRYEIIEPSNSSSPLNKVLESKNTNKIHHIAYLVEDIDQKCDHFREKGYGFLTKYFAAKVFNGARVIFLMSPLGFILELIEKK
jgi:catechol 2,3-dioxygenase-like lactoylglutathione lyase family enzyme